MFELVNRNNGVLSYTMIRASLLSIISIDDRQSYCELEKAP